MYPHSPLWHYFWIAPHALQAGLAVLMIRRRLWTEFPFFFSYTLVEAVGGTILFVLDHLSSVSPHQYWTAHWSFLGIGIALRFGVVYEIFKALFRSYPALAGLSRRLLRWSSALLVIVAVLIVARATPRDEAPILFWLHLVGVSVAIVQSGVLLFLFIFSSYFRISWKNYIFGVVAGFGLFSIVSLATESVPMIIGPAAGSYVLDFVGMVAYHCSVVIWLTYLLLPDSEAIPITELPDQQVEQWNQALQRLFLQ